MRLRALTFLFVGLLVSSGLPLATAEGPVRHLVTLREGASASDLASAFDLRVVGGDGNVAVLEGGQARGLARDPRVVSVEPDGRVRASAAGWDAAGWDGATWDGATWDGASWDGASWDGASRDGASWDGASWDGASWDGATWDGAGSGEARSSWMLRAIRAPEAWENGLHAAKRTVCIVDTGIDDDHPLLAHAIWRDARGSYGRDFVDADDDPDDAAGHGTHLAGILAAKRGPFGVQGVGAPLVAGARVLGADGTGATSAVIAALSWCGDIGAHVVLLALTEDAPTRALRESVARAQARGMLVVASAGNAGPCERCVSYPSAYPGVVAVGAMTPDARIATFSSSGPQLTLVAPGVEIVSTFPGGMYRSGSGTSQAAAVVAGAAALVWSQSPDLSARDISKILTSTAHALDGGARGERLVDAGAASAKAVGR